VKCPVCQAEIAEGPRVCSACGVLLDVSWDVERIRAQLRRWQERLLDLTKANPLLGVNRSRVSRLRVVEPAIHAVFRDLVVEERRLRMPRVVKLSPASAGNDQEEDTGAEQQYRIEAGDLTFEAGPAGPADLHRKTRRIHDNARTSLEERGVTTLHVSFGVLSWQDPELGESMSPLWLVPCELESFGPSAPMRLLAADEEMQLNPALELYLRERHRLVLPPLPDEAGEADLIAFLEDVHARVRERGWKVDGHVWLSTYSFESLVLYQDLKAMEEAAVHNRVVAALARATPLGEASEGLGEEALDAAPCPAQVPVPVLATDSSQLRALTVATAGRHLVVHGPPGTGKSQTITNLIAEAVGQGKSVLFVSAKMAALDVVHRRLAALGLDRFCLEAHSTKAGKAKIIEELRRTLAAAERAEQSDRFEERLDDLLRVRQELNTYVRALHERRAPLGVSVYEAIGTAERLANRGDIRGPLPWQDPLAVTRADLASAVNALEDVAAQAEVFDQRARHPWRGLAVHPGRTVPRELIENDPAELRSALRGLLGSLLSLEPLLGSGSPLSLEKLRELASALGELATVEALPRDWTTRERSELQVTADLLDQAAANAEEEASRHAQHESAWRLAPDEVARLLAPAETEFRGVTRVLLLSYWRWRRSLREHLRPGAPASFGALRASLEGARRLLELGAWFAAHRERLTGEVGAVEVRDPGPLRRAAREARVASRFRTALGTVELAPPAPTPVLTDDLRRAAAAVAAAVDTPAWQGPLERLEALWPAGFVDGVRAASAPLGTVLARCEEVLAALQRAHEWIVLQHTLHRCADLGLSGFVASLGSTSAREAPGAFERRFYMFWANAALEGTPALALFTGVRREQLIDRFRQLDESVRMAALARIKALASEPARRVAGARDVPGTSSEVGILRRELERQRRFKPLRKLFGEIPNVLKALKPCMLMSPLSVSTFLKPGAISFDLVVFDEASQLPTPEAIPAILRGAQVVVAGDSKQLPPTSFFKASVIFDETPEAEAGEEFEPLESLLDDCVAIFPVFDQAHLRWHYRSRDERLIKFSNHYFYREKPLITFPSVSTATGDRGVRWVYVPDGVWDRGGSRTNRAEAREVVKLLVEHLECRPDRSLGVVAMNVAQREAIEELLDELLLERPDLVPRLRAHVEEPFFIKALENVQGDERDTIMISVGYGRTASGALSYNFGPLNQEGGWRRLNVLVTRARWQTILVTSMRAHELSGINPNNPGAVALRNFIEYAERGCELPPAPTVITEHETNDFEDAVAERLRERGLRVDQQVGASEYRIDLAIRDPRDPHRYLLGVECDGATYHSAKTARDRDLLREQVLHDLGWRLHRIWSTNWFRDPDRAIETVLRAVERAQREPVERSVVAPPTAGSAEASSTKANPGTRYAESPRPEPAPAETRRYRPGVAYRKYRGPGRRELLLEREHRRALATQVLEIVEVEGPIHRALLPERLKEVNGVARAGVNVQANIETALALALREGRLEEAGPGFVKRSGSTVETFRVPGDGVERPLPWIPGEEIELAVLHLVEDQFGCQRGALPRAIAGVFGFERAPAGLTEVVETAVDRLIDGNRLASSGPNVHLV